MFRYTDTVAGTPSITAADHAAVLTQASQTQTVTAGTAAVIRVETAADGSGTVVPAQNVTAGNSITVYSISRDTYGNFVANVATDAAGWSLTNKTGGVANGDLVAAGDLKSATFTGHLVGTATIHAAKSGLVSTDSGTIAVVAGAATQLRVETAADGSGTVVPAQNVTAGSSITVYSISRDAQGNFVANVATDASGWSLANVTGGVVSGDLVAAGDLKSASFSGHLVGSAKIHAVKSGLSSTDSGTVTVIAESATVVRVETAANGSGTVVPAQNVTAGSSITVFSITRDTYGNFVANVAATAWSLPTKTGGVVDGDLAAAGDFKSATFTGHLVGTATIRATSGALAATDTGTITVAAGSATQIRVETVGNGTGTVVPAQSVTAGSSINVFAISRDSQGNFVANVATDAAGWSLTNITGGVVSGDLVAAGDLKSATFTGHLVGSAKIHAVKGGLTSTDSGTITVVAGSATKYVFTTAAQTLTAGNASAQLSSTITVQLQDAGGNPVNAASNTSVGLSSTAAPGVFRDTADSATITSIMMTGGTNSVTFKYRSTLAGSQTLTAHTAGLTDGTQAEFVNSAPVSLSWNCPSGTVGKTQTITVTISVPADAFGNAFTRNTALAVTVSLTVNDNSQYTVGGSTTSTTVNITTGPATNTFTLVTASGSNKNATVHASVGAGFTAPADSSMKTS